MKNYMGFTQEIVAKLSKIWVWDPGYGKNLFQVPDPGSGFAVLAITAPLVTKNKQDAH
jgi:hypothetical protein